MARRAARFLQRPSLGGWLAIANCSGWVILAAIDRGHIAGSTLAEPLMTAAALVLSCPLVCTCSVLLGAGSPTAAGWVAIGAIVGVNSFIWGYGIAALGSGIVNRRRRRRYLASFHLVCTACGYDLRATPERCPECGTVPEHLEHGFR